ncbi:MAG: threonine--tRNA ligase [Thermoplasmatales archaeon B_DKE]|nr:MAG: threonine--tRNA ligase [Thermoplasmatales archaeon B_DKE]
MSANEKTIKLRFAGGESFEKSVPDRLKKEAVAVECAGKLLDLSAIPEKDSDCNLLTKDSPQALGIMRHSAAHLLAQVITEMYPDALPNAGPVTEDGFYYDFDMKPISSDDLASIESKMKEIAKKGEPVVREEHSREELLKIFQSNRYKIDKIMANVGEDGYSSVYRQGGFVDFCKGPHVPDASFLQSVKLLSIAATHYKGDENEKPMIRIYGTAFPSEKELNAYIKMREEASLRDHRKIGTEMDLFLFNSERAPGFPLYTPNGVIIRNELMNFMREKNSERGWMEVWTPHVFRDTMWKQSGHYAKYKPDMFTFELENHEGYGLKPMNCPGHITIFERSPHSYKDLPVRYSEFGTVYRYEKSGEVGGLTRPRAFTQDDGHAFLSMDQILEEVKSLISLVRETYKTVLGTTEATFDLSLMDREHPELYLVTFICRDCQTRIETRRGTSEEKFTCPNCGSEHLDPDLSLWDQASGQLREALIQSGLDFKEYPGESAFYGPKIDVHTKDAIGRSWQLSTIQLDFFLPTNFGLYYINSQGKKDRIVMIHRAIFGSLERFMAILLEHYAGKLPTWLSPMQVYLSPVSAGTEEYARKINQKLKENGIRTTLDLSPETISKKIKMIREKRPSYIGIVGEKESTDGTITIRGRDNKQKTYVVEDFITEIKKEIRERNIAQMI